MSEMPQPAVLATVTSYAQPDTLYTYSALYVAVLGVDEPGPSLQKTGFMQGESDSSSPPCLGLHAASSQLEIAQYVEVFAGGCRKDVCDQSQPAPFVWAVMGGWG